MRFGWHASYCLFALRRSGDVAQIRIDKPPGTITSIEGQCGKSLKK
jgi:hypothetical protein